MSRPGRSSAPPRRSDARSPTTSAPSPSRPHLRPRQRCTSGWTVPAFRCAPPKSKVAAASNPTVRPRPARSSWSPCGRPKGATNRAGPSATPGSVSYNAAVESAASRDTDPQPAAFANRVHREAQRRGFDTAARRVVIGDGAAWIWNLAAEQFPGAIEIVDIYHAKQHLCDVAKAIYGAGTDLADAWAKARHAELDAGRLRALVTVLRTRAETTPEARKCIHYVFGNRHRMRYPQFRARGLCISSGVVEAGCKQIGARLKRAGMRWTIAGGNAIIALRCCLLSGRFEDFWERRAANAA